MPSLSRWSFGRTLKAMSSSSTYFACWNAAGSPAELIGHLSFEQASAVRSFTRGALAVSGFATQPSFLQSPCSGIGVCSRAHRLPPVSLPEFISKALGAQPLRCYGSRHLPRNPRASFHGQHYCKPERYRSQAASSDRSRIGTRHVQVPYRHETCAICLTWNFRKTA
jgi:hypothetical protein